MPPILRSTAKSGAFSVAEAIHLPPVAFGRAALFDGGSGLGLQAAADRLSAAQGFSEPVVVLVDAGTASADVERFVSDDLVEGFSAAREKRPTRFEGK